MGDECRKAFESEWNKYPANRKLEYYHKEAAFSFFRSAWNRRPAPQPDKALVDIVEQELDTVLGHNEHHTNTAMAELLARRLADRFGGWVSVEERLPEKKNGRFLITNGVYVKDSGWTPYYENLWGFNEANDYFKVTHWRPLPAPPSGKEAGGE